MIRTLLIANRGEIACRIIRTCRRLGIRAIAVYSSADKDALHVRMADDSVPLGSPDAKDSYLNIEKIISAAKKKKADAVHPGYGFLAENADFAKRLRKEKIIFLGPSPEAMALLGDKLSAKSLAAKLKVPVSPSLEVGAKHLSDKKTIAAIEAFAKKVGLPLLVKAAAGGGGRGMRRVEKKAEIAGAVESASREAAAFFRDGTVFIEKLIEHARHVEVQIFGDGAGNVISLYDRDCSMQRHHQKVIEEAPAPLLSEKTRKKMHEAAEKLCQKARYSGAGTVEFLVDRNEDFYFLEVNSRLQVEHPVTEAITGLDLVELQIQIANGLSLKHFHKPTASGHAIEARLCAEAPENDFIPSTGLIAALQYPSEAGLRVDTGFQAGDVVSHYYDSLLAKVVVHAPTRLEAVAALERAMSKIHVAGVATNSSFLLKLLSTKAFKEIRHDITFAKTALPSEKDEELRAKLAAGLVVIASMNSGVPAGDVSTGSSDTSRNFRLWGTPAAFGNYRILGRSVSVRVAESVPGEFCVYAHTGTSSTRDSSPAASVHSIAWHPDGIGYVRDGQCGLFRTERLSNGEIWTSGSLGIIKIDPLAHVLNRSDTDEKAHDTAVSSSLPGKIIALRVRPGEKVREGDALIVIESMKMEHVLRAPADGSVESIDVAQGAVIEAGAPLVRLTYDV